MKNFGVKKTTNYYVNIFDYIDRNFVISQRISWRTCGASVWHTFQYGFFFLQKYTYWYMSILSEHVLSNSCFYNLVFINPFMLKVIKYSSKFIKLLIYLQIGK